MLEPIPFPSTAIRAPSPSAHCTCDHPVNCDHTCHGRYCDPAENACDLAYLPDEGGLTYWGCPACSPGQVLPHFLGCEMMGWNVPLGRRTPG